MSTDEIILAELNAYSATDLVNALVARGAMDMLDVKQMIDGRYFGNVPEEQRSEYVLRLSAAGVNQLAGWCAENGIINTVVAEREPGDEGPLEHMPPGSLLITTGMMALVPGYDMNDR